MVITSDRCMVPALRRFPRTWDDTSALGGMAVVLRDPSAGMVRRYWRPRAIEAWLEQALIVSDFGQRGMSIALKAFDLL